MVIMQQQPQTFVRGRGRGRGRSRGRGLARNLSDGSEGDGLDDCTDGERIICTNADVDVDVDFANNEDEVYTPSIAPLEEVTDSFSLQQPAASPKPELVDLRSNEAVAVAVAAAGAAVEIEGQGDAAGEAGGGGGGGDLPFLKSEFFGI